MQMTQQVCSLELAKKLKELGVKQESLFYHFIGAVTGNHDLRMGWDSKGDINFTNSQTYSAFTVAELGELLPRYIADADQPLSGVKGKQYPLIIECLADDYSSDNKINGWRIRYGDTKVKFESEYKLNSAGIYYIGNEADARAKMLIHLIENKLI